MKKHNQRTDELPAPPAWLDDAAKTTYADAATALTKAGIELLPSDANTLAAYAQASADYIRLTGEIRHEGELVEGYRKQPVKNPKLTVLKSAFDRMRDAGNRLGLNPKARIGTPRIRHLS